MIDKILSPLLSCERLERINDVLDFRITGISLLVEGLYDVGNLAAIMRTCDGLGVLRVGVIETIDRYRAVRKVTQGCHKWLDLYRFMDADSAVARFREMGYRLAVSDLTAEQELNELDFSRPTTLVFGNEHAGVTERLISQCDHRFRIDMHGFSQSFNVSVAAAICLHRATRQWRQQRESTCDLEPEQRQCLRERYLRLAVERSDQILSNLGIDVDPLPEEPPYLGQAPELLNGHVNRFVTRDGEWE